MASLNHCWHQSRRKICKCLFRVILTSLFDTSQQSMNLSWFMTENVKWKTRVKMIDVQLSNQSWCSKSDCCYQQDLRATFSYTQLRIYSWRKKQMNLKQPLNSEVFIKNVSLFKLSCLFILKKNTETQIDAQCDHLFSLVTGTKQKSGFAYPRLQRTIDWTSFGAEGRGHSPLSIWHRDHTQPSPCWSEANLPTPLCRILGIAAHRDAVMCHLALGPVGQELSLTSPLKLVCHWEPRQAASRRTTCVHSPRDEDRAEGDCRHLLGKLRLPLPLNGFMSRWPPEPHSCRSKIVHLVVSQPTTLCLLDPLLITISSKTAWCLMEEKPERFWKK